MNNIDENDGLDSDTINLINDLWCALALYVNGYPFDENHKEKHLRLIRRAKDRLRIPGTLEELVSHLNECAELLEKKKMGNNEQKI